MLRRIVIAAVAVCALGTVHIQAQKNEFFRPKEVWNDTEGNPINAHGGGILYHKGTYYWYGEYKVGKTVLRCNLGALSHRRNRSKLLLQ